MTDATTEADGARGPSRTLTVLHDIPGRLRLRLPVGVTTAGLAEAVAQIPGVLHAAWSARTRSLLVLYRPGETNASTVVEAVADHADADQPAPPAPATMALVRTARAEAGGGSLIGTAVSDTFGQVNTRVHRFTRGLLGIGDVVTVSLTIWAIREMFLGRTAPLVWSSALWYAHGLFRDYNVPPAEK